MVLPPKYLFKVTDQRGLVCCFKQYPKRIVSIVPSQTELLHYLGLHDEVIGITKFCIHPDEWHRNKQRIGGTKTLDIALIKSLKPDLIIANKEENTKEQVMELMDDFLVWSSDIKTLDDALQMIAAIGTIANKEQKAAELIVAIETAFQFAIPYKITNVAYLIWNDPLMTVNADTFIHHMLWRCGLQNVFADRNDSRYPIINDAELIAASPEVILLSSEPFPFRTQHVARFKYLLPDVEVILVDGEMFSWYGSRLRVAPSYFSQVIAKVVS